MMKTIISGGVALSLLTVSAFGADLAVPPSFSAPPSPPPFTWTSCYGGLHAGGGWGQKDLTDSAGILTIGTPGATANLGISGYMLGGQFGCDYQFASNWVLGIEGAVSGGDIGGTINSTNISTGGGDSTTFHETTDFLGGVTGRVGFAWDRWLVYGKGGIAWAGDRYSALDAFQLYNYNGVETRSGWTAGAGVEWALWKDWSVKLEYDYYGFGQGNVNFIDSTIGAPPGLENIKQTVQVVQLGVNFHFFAGP